jgi:Protein of unknown function (DUF2934)
VKTDDDKIRKRRAPVKARAKENNMADVMKDLRMASSSQGEPSFPDEWISIAAYYIWKNEGEPEGRDGYFWDRAKVELSQLYKEGNLPINQPSGRDVLEEER